MDSVHASPPHVVNLVWSPRLQDACPTPSGVAPHGALSQAWTCAEASLPFAWQLSGLYRFDDLGFRAADYTVRCGPHPILMKARLVIAKT
jgi:hypothetical protein